MNHFLYAREIGLDQSSVLKSTETTRRIFSLDISTSKEFSREHGGPINCLDIEQIEGRYMLSGGNDSSIHLYDLEEPLNVTRIKYESLQVIPRNRGHRYAVSGISWYPFDTGMFLSSSFDHTIKVWDTNSLQEACNFDLQNKVFSHSVSNIASHCLVASASTDPRIRLCDLRTGAFTHSLPGHRGSVFTVQWSPKDEYILVSGGADKSIRLWDIRRSTSNLALLDQHNSGDSLLSFTNTAHTSAVNGLSFHPDGNYLLSLGHDEKLHLWNMSNLTNTLVNYGSYIRNRSGQAVIPVPVGGNGLGVVFVPSEDYQILMFDIAEGSLIKKLRGSFDKVCCVAWRDGWEELYSGSADKEILVYEAVMVGWEDERREEVERDNWSDEESE